MTTRLEVLNHTFNDPDSRFFEDQGQFVATLGSNLDRVKAALVDLGLKPGKNLFLDQHSEELFININALPDPKKAKSEDFLIEPNLVELHSNNLGEAFNLPFTPGPILYSRDASRPFERRMMIETPTSEMANRLSEVLADTRDKMGMRREEMPVGYSLFRDNSFVSLSARDVIRYERLNGEGSFVEKLRVTLDENPALKEELGSMGAVLRSPQAEMLQSINHDPAHDGVSVNRPNIAGLGSARQIV